MSSISPSSRSPEAHAAASSSRAPRNPSPPTNDSPAQNDDDVEEEENLLADDYLNRNGDVNAHISFKRSAKAVKPSLASRLLSSPFSGSRNATPSPGPTGNGSRRLRAQGGTRPSTNTILSYLNSSAVDPSLSGIHDAKDAAGLDWYVEGPGRRVGYDNLTAIDWIYEYAKERTRIQHLAANAPGIIGQLKLVADASQFWWILVATGIAVGGIAAGIDVASDWLGDLKTGVCSNVDEGGKFYLNKVFCCWGVGSLDACSDWRAWSAVLGVANRGGGYVLEYLFFVCFSVSLHLNDSFATVQLIACSGHVRLLRYGHGQPLFTVCEAVRHTRDQDSTWRLCHPTLPWCLDTGRQVDRPMSCRSIRHVAWQRRPSCPRRLLLCERLHEALSQHQWK